MSEKSDTPFLDTPSEPETYFWVSILIAIIPVGEIIHLDFPLKSVSAEKACLLAQIIFAAGAYRETSKTWSISGIPCEPIGYFATPCPEYLHESMERKISAYTADAEAKNVSRQDDDENKVVPLFPNRSTIFDVDDESDTDDA